MAIILLYSLSLLFTLSFFFFFNDTATTEIYTLSYTTLFRSKASQLSSAAPGALQGGNADALYNEGVILWNGGKIADRSEEHTSELQSQFHLVCRLLLEKKKKTTTNNK